MVSFLFLPVKIPPNNFFKNPFTELLADHPVKNFNPAAIEDEGIKTLDESTVCLCWWC